MFSFLLQNYPLLGEFVIEKLDFPSLDILRPTCAEVDRFLSKKYIRPVKELYFQQNKSSNEIYLVDSSETYYCKSIQAERSDKFCEKSFFTSIQRKKIHAAAVKYIEIEGRSPEEMDDSHGSIGVLEGRISCGTLLVKHSTEGTILRYTNALRPRELHILETEDHRKDFLADPRLQCVEEVFLTCGSVKIDLNAIVTSIKYLSIHCDSIYDDDILTFLEKWFNGQQTLRRLCISHGIRTDNGLTEAIQRQFGEYCSLTPEGTIRMKSKRGVAFISNSDRSFFFRSVGIEEEERLKPLFQKGNLSFWTEKDAEAADSDCELNDSRSFENTSFNETTCSFSSHSDAFNDSNASDFNSEVSLISNGMSDISLPHNDSHIRQL